MLNPCSVRALDAPRPRDQADQAQGVSSVQGKLGDPPLVDQGAHLVGGRLDQRSVTMHRDGFGQFADLELDIDLGVTVKGKLNSFLDGRFEPRQSRPALCTFRSTGSGSCSCRPRWCPPIGSHS